MLFEYSALYNVRIERFDTHWINMKQVQNSLTHWCRHLWNARNISPSTESFVSTLLTCCSLTIDVIGNLVILYLWILQIVLFVLQKYVKGVFRVLNQAVYVFPFLLLKIAIFYVYQLYMSVENENNLRSNMFLNCLSFIVYFILFFFCKVPLLGIHLWHGTNKRRRRTLQLYYLFFEVSLALVEYIGWFYIFETISQNAQNFYSEAKDNPIGSNSPHDVVHINISTQDHTSLEVTAERELVGWVPEICDGFIVILLLFLTHALIPVLFAVPHMLIMIMIKVLQPNSYPDSLQNDSPNGALQRNIYANSSQKVFTSTAKIDRLKVMLIIWHLLRYLISKVQIIWLFMVFFASIYKLTFQYLILLVSYQRFFEVTVHILVPLQMFAFVYACDKCLQSLKKVNMEEIIKTEQLSALSKFNWITDATLYIMFQDFWSCPYTLYFMNQHNRYTLTMQILWLRLKIRIWTSIDNLEKVYQETGNTLYKLYR